MAELGDLTIGVIPLALVIVALVEVAKRAGLPSQYAPWLNAVLAVAGYALVLLPLAPVGVWAGVRMARHKMYFSPVKAIRELGLPQTPPETALADKLRKLVSAERRRRLGRQCFGPPRGRGRVGDPEHHRQLGGA